MPVRPALPETGLRFFRLIVFLSCLLLCWQTLPAHAGTACDDAPPDARKIMQAMNFALRVQEALNDSGAELAIIARAGQDLSQYHLVYSHLGVIRKMPDGRWFVLHELNHCGTSGSGLFEEGLGNFFLDDMFRFRSLILIPPQPLQQAMLARISDGTALALHEPQYNMLSYAFSTRYQNSNQWGLELLATAADPRVHKRSEAQRWLRAMQYKPDVIDVPAMTRLGARMFRANIRFDDHPFGDRMAGKIATVTVESVQQFMWEHALTENTLEIDGGMPERKQ